MSISVLLLGTSRLKQDMLWNEFQHAGFQVFIAQSAQEALHLMESEAIHMLITNGHLPDANVPELLLMLESMRPQMRIMVLTDAQTPEVQHWLRTRGITSFSPHSYDLVGLRQRLDQQLEHDRERRFHFSNLNLFDIIQILAASLHHTHLYLAEPHSAREGLLYFSQGQVCHAVFGDLSGEAAFHAIMQMEAGYFALAELARPEYYTIESQLSKLLTRSALQCVGLEKQSFRGELRNLNLLEVLQVLSISGQSYTVRVTDLYQGENGQIHMNQGKIEHIFFHDLKGLDALKQMLGIAAGDFHFSAYTPPSEYTFEGSFNQYLLQLTGFQDQAFQYIPTAL